MHGFANLATAFQITGIKTITGLRVERRTLGQRLHNEGAQILVRLALQDGALLLRHPEPAEQNIGVYIQEHRLPTIRKNAGLEEIDVKALDKEL